MTKQLRLGTSDFDKIIEEDTLIVDKTLFIKEFMEDGVDVTCILRPRYVVSNTILKLTHFLDVSVKVQTYLCLNLFFQLALLLKTLIAIS